MDEKEQPVWQVDRVPYAGNRVGTRSLIRGYNEAVRRRRDAALLRDPDPAFFATFEALNWAVAIDDVVAEIWRPAGAREGYEWRDRVDDGEVMDGLRYVRNLVHHHWADAMKIEEGARLPIRFPIAFFTWVWRGSDELPPPTTKRDTERRRLYNASLADQPVENTLLRLATPFAFVGPLLRPPRAIDPKRQG